MGGADALNAHLKGRGMFIGRTGPTVSAPLSLPQALQLQHPQRGGGGGGE